MVERAIESIVLAKLSDHGLKLLTKDSSVISQCNSLELLLNCTFWWLRCNLKNAYLL